MSSSSPIDNTCNAPLVFYSCVSNGFKGCCAVDPCGLLECPNNQVESSTSLSAAVSSSKPTGIQVSSDATSISDTASFPNPSATTYTPAAASSSPLSSPGQLMTSHSPASSQPQDNAATTSGLPAATSTEPPVTVVVTSLLIVVPDIVTPTSNGKLLAPTSSMLTSTSLSLRSTIVTTTTGSSNSAAAKTFTSAPNTPSAPSKLSHDQSSKTPVIAGTVGGVGGAVLAVLLILLVVRWQRRRNARHLRAGQHDDDPRLQGIDANRAGYIFEKEGDCSFEGRMVSGNFVRDALIPVGESEPGVKGSEGKQVRFSPISPLSPVPHQQVTVPTITHTTPAKSALRSAHPELARSPLYANGIQPELSGEPAFYGPAELSPSPERSTINTPVRSPISPQSYNGDSAVSSLSPEGSMMHPTLELSTDGTGQRVREGRHVTSWQSFDGRAGFA